MDENNTPAQITIAHPTTLSGADILDIVNSEVDQDTPVVIQAIPSTSPKVAAYVQAGEVALAVINSITQRIHAAHKAVAAKS